METSGLPVPTLHAELEVRGSREGLPTMQTAGS